MFKIKPLETIDQMFGRFQTMEMLARYAGDHKMFNLMFKDYRHPKDTPRVGYEDNESNAKTTFISFVSSEIYKDVILENNL